MVFGPVSVMCVPKNETPENSSYPPPLSIVSMTQKKKLTLYMYKKMSYIFSTPSNIYMYLCLHLCLFYIRPYILSLHLTNSIEKKKYIKKQ